VFRALRRSGRSEDAERIMNVENSVFQARSMTGLACRLDQLAAGMESNALRNRPGRAIADADLIESDDLRRTALQLRILAEEARTVSKSSEADALERITELLDRISAATRLSA
jgi:hypothetical protein